MHETNAADIGQPEAVEIRPGTVDDRSSIVEILNYEALNSHATLLSRPVGVADRLSWFERFSCAGPHQLWVAAGDHHVLGYATSAPYRDHESFRATVEVGIALGIESRGRSIGTRLYQALLESLDDEESVHTILAGILLPNEASIALHRKFGFVDVGTFHEYAQKNGRFLSSLWMERRSPIPDPTPQPMHHP